MQQKKCAHCKEFKDADVREFSLDKKNSDGFYSWCRECKRKSHQVWRNNNVFRDFDPESIKACSCCDKEKPRKAFVPSKDYPDGVTAKCRECINASAREWSARPEVNARQKPLKKFKAMKQHYGFSKDEYLSFCALYENCPICLRSFDSLRKNVDHDHITGAVRGALCNNCNSLLGLVNEDTGLLLTLFEYLNKYSDYPEGNHYSSTKGRHNLQKSLYAELMGSYCACDTCGVSFDEIRKILDHDHDSGRIRGVLCIICNLALGAAHDSPETLLRAITYLNKHNSLVSSNNGTSDD